MMIVSVIGLVLTLIACALQIPLYIMDISGENSRNKKLEYIFITVAILGLSISTIGLLLGI